jgi:diguanylate cyclase (GGDEF)-like protein
VKDATRPDRKKQAEACRSAARLCGWLAFSAAVIFSAGLLSARQAASAQSATKAPASLRTLTTAHEVHSLSTEESRRAYPVHLRAVVTYLDPSYGAESASMFVHDASGGVYVSLRAGIKEKLPPGTLLDVLGVSGPGGFAPIVEHAQVKVIGHAPLPANPRRISVTRLLTGAEDCQWVELEGVIRSVVEHGHNIRMRLQMEGGIVTAVMVKEAGASYSGLVASKVRIRATAAPMFNKNSQMISARLLVPGLSAIKILEPARGDPFQLPVIPIDGLLRWDHVDTRFHLTHVRGTVTLQWQRPGSLVCIRDATSGICALTDENTHLAVGDVVDVVGFVAAQDGTPYISHPMFRNVGSHGVVTAEPVTVQQVLQGKHDSEPIQIDGQLIGYGLATSDITLLLTSGSDLFTAVLPKKLIGPDLTPWQIGSRLRVTGISSIRLDTEGSAATEGIAEPESFRVLMRSPADVAVLERPSWWTAAHMLALLAVAILITLVVLGWVMSLKRQVARQTVLLRESEQRFRHMALHDALTGLATRLLLQDRLNTAVVTANRHQAGLTLLMLDLDNFKYINDSLGHRAGDEVLRVTAARLLEVVRKSDTVARMGGDEFIVLLPDLSDPESAERIAAIIVEALAVPITFEGNLVRISASVGVCSAPAGLLDAETLLKCADAALYHAKASGRNRFQAFITDMAVEKKQIAS